MKRFDFPRAKRVRHGARDTPSRARMLKGKAGVLYKLLLSNDSPGRLSFTATPSSHGSAIHRMLDS